MERGGYLEYYKALREGRKNFILTQPKSSNPWVIFPSFKLQSVAGERYIQV